MSTRRLIDPELLEGLAFFPPFALQGADLVALREMAAAALPSPDSYARSEVSTEIVMVPGFAGAPNVRTIVYRPLNVPGPLPVFLSIHGGGFLFGTAADMGPADTRTAAEVACVVVSPEYRLAPETRAPGAVEDCYAVLRWLHANADNLQIDRKRIAAGGMSAGAGLAAALALMVRDRGDEPLCFQLLIYPMLDDRTAVRSAAQDNSTTGEFVWTRDNNRIAWEQYLGHSPGIDGVSAYAAPARAADLTGLPPAYITVGSLDLFIEEDVSYAQRLMRAGVATELHVLPGAYHGFELAAGSQLATRSERERRRALARAFGTCVHA